MSIIEQIKSVQAKLGLLADGNAGPKTWAAIYQKIAIESRLEKIRAKGVSGNGLPTPSGFLKMH